jgi:hypothetical protein
MKAISSIGSSNILAISSTNRCTIGFPAIGISGFGIVKVCGRRNHVLPLVLLFSYLIYITSKFFIPSWKFKLF